MNTDLATCRFQQVHVDAARNATDDFNPFHDPHRWQEIRNNPFGGPIVLGFQLEALVDDRIEWQRRYEAGGFEPAARYSRYEFHFAGALRPGEPFTVQVRRTMYRDDDAQTAMNRVMVRKLDGSAVLLGSRSDSMQSQFPADWGPDLVDRLEQTADRSYLPGTSLFIKRKYLNTSNGKNFLLGSLVDQYHYFDELEDRVLFPPVFTASLLSCALLERGKAAGYDFKGDPQVYVAHHISVDRHVQQALCSNDRLDLVVAAPVSTAEGKGLTNSRIGQQVYRCIGVAAGRGILFEARVHTAALHALLGR